MTAIPSAGDEKSGPLVSIGLPVYNENEIFAKRLRNLAEQSYENLEFCISDNASDDGTFEQISKFAVNRENVKVFRFLKNAGVIENLKKTAEMATGKYFVWAAADDEWHPEFISALTEALERYPRCQLAMSSYVHRLPDGKLRRVVFSEEIHRNKDIAIYQLMRRLITGNPIVKSKGKYNLFIYGLYRADVLKKILANHRDVFNFGDRLLPALVIAMGGGRCVDRFLFTKVQNELPYALRSPDDPLRRTKQSYYNSILKTLLLFWRSPVLPFYGKMIALLVLAEVWNYRIKFRVISAIRLIFPKIR